jgi:hypothetical protein
MGKWFWVVVAAGGLYYLSKREEASIKIQANRQATSAVNHAGNAVNNLIDSGASALGKFLSGLGGSSGKSTSSGSSTSGYPYPSLAPEDDPSISNPDYDYSE